MSEFEKYRYVNELSYKNKLMRLLWGITWLIAFRSTPRWTMHGWRRSLLRLFGAKIGKGSKIAPDCKIWAPWNLSVGEYSTLADGVDCYSMDKIIIGSKVAISQRAYLCTGTHRIDTLKRPLITKPITIGDHVWVAAESILLPGVSIGEGAVIGARSVVTKDIPSWKVCAGNPCRLIKDRIVDQSN